MEPLADNMEKHEHDPQKERAHIIHEATALVDDYNSERNRAEHEVLGRDHKYMIGSVEEGVLVCGVRHSNDTESPTIQTVESEMRHALETVSPEKLTFMVEGMHGRTDSEALHEEFSRFETREQAIDMFGEKGAVFWALKQRSAEGQELRVLSPEKPDAAIRDTLLKEGHSLDAITAYLGARELSAIIQHKHLSEDLIFDISRALYDEFQLNDFEWTGPIEAPEELVALHEEDPEAFDRKIRGCVDAYLSRFVQHFQDAGIDLSLTYEDLVAAEPHGELHQQLSHLMDPMDFHGVETDANKAGASWNRERDRFLVETIASEMLDDRVPFVVFGASHAISIQPAIEKLLKSVKK